MYTLAAGPVGPSPRCTGTPPLGTAPVPLQVALFQAPTPHHPGVPPQGAYPPGWAPMPHMGRPAQPYPNAYPPCTGHRTRLISWLHRAFRRSETAKPTSSWVGTFELCPFSLTVLAFDSRPRKFMTNRQRSVRSLHLTSRHCHALVAPTLVAFRTVYQGDG